MLFQPSRQTPGVSLHLCCTHLYTRCQSIAKERSASLFETTLHFLSIHKKVQYTHVKCIQLSTSGRCSHDINVMPSQTKCDFSEIVLLALAASLLVAMLNLGLINCFAYTSTNGVRVTCKHADTSHTVQISRTLPAREIFYSLKSPSAGVPPHLFIFAKLGWKCRQPLY